MLWLTTLAPHGTADDESADTEWPAYGNDPGGQRFVSLVDIHPGNVADPGHLA